MFLQAAKADVHSQEEVLGCANETRFIKSWFLIFSLVDWKCNLLQAAYPCLFSWDGWFKIKSLQSGTGIDSCQCLSSTGHHSNVKPHSTHSALNVERLQHSFWQNIPLSLLPTRTSVCSRGFLSSTFIATFDQNQQTQNHHNSHETSHSPRYKRPSLGFFKWQGTSNGDIFLQFAIQPTPFWPPGLGQRLKSDFPTGGKMKYWPGAASISPYFALTPYIDIDPPSKLMNNNNFNNQGRICHHEDRKVIISKHHNDVAVVDDDDAKKEGWRMKMKVWKVLVGVL